jgi:glycosyltransferase involved in cell wall biosynthesis
MELQDGEDRLQLFTLQGAENFLRAYAQLSVLEQERRVTYWVPPEPRPTTQALGAYLGADVRYTGNDYTPWILSRPPDPVLTKATRYESFYLQNHLAVDGHTQHWYPEYPVRDLQEQLLRGVKGTRPNVPLLYLGGALPGGTDVPLHTNWYQYAGHSMYWKLRPVVDHLSEATGRLLRQIDLQPWNEMELEPLLFDPLGEWQIPELMECLASTSTVIGRPGLTTLLASILGKPLHLYTPDKLRIDWNLGPRKATQWTIPWSSLAKSDIDFSFYNNVWGEFPKLVEPKNRPLRVGILTPAMLIGGVEQWILSLVQHTDRQRLSWEGVAVLYPENLDTRMSDRIEPYCPVGVGLGEVARLSRSCDVLLAWGLPEWWNFLPPDRKCQVVYVNHGVGDWSTASCKGASHANGLVAVSTASKDCFPVSHRSRVQVIPNGTDRKRLETSQTKESQKWAWGIAPDKKVLGFLGRFAYEKNPDLLVSAVAALPEDWVGVMVGSGSPEAESGLKSLAEACCPGRIFFPGPTEDVGGALTGFDVLLVPSHEEGFCYVVIEAWLNGTPVVATPTGVAAEEVGLVAYIQADALGYEVAEIVEQTYYDSWLPVLLKEGVSTATEKYSQTAFGANWTNYLCSFPKIERPQEQLWDVRQLPLELIPGVQVVLAAHNAGPWLQRCLDSIEVAMEGLHWGLFLADDASTDDTLAIAKAHRTSADYVRIQSFAKARTTGEAKNRALALGADLRETLPAIVHMDADDVMMPGRVRFLLAQAVRTGKPLVHGTVRFRSVPPQGVAQLLEVAGGNREQYEAANLTPCITLHHACLIPEDHKLFCEDLRAIEDGELWTRLRLSGIQSVPCPGPLSHDYYPHWNSTAYNPETEINIERYYRRRALLKQETL